MRLFSHQLSKPIVNCLAEETICYTNFTYFFFFIKEVSDKLTLVQDDQWTQPRLPIACTYAVGQSSQENSNCRFFLNFFLAKQNKLMFWPCLVVLEKKIIIYIHTFEVLNVD